jgi:hypothetical protein
MRKKYLTMMLLLEMGLSVMCSHGGHKSQAELDKMTAEQLVREYSTVEMYHQGCKQYRDQLKNTIMSKPKDALVAIAKVFDEYDPATFMGRIGRKSIDAYWALALLHWIDCNRFRVRGTEEGRLALESCRKLLERKKAALKSRSKPDESQEHVYIGESMEYASMCGINAIDKYIRKQLKEAHQVEMTEEEFSRFVDFLVTKDPAYVAWSERGIGIIRNIVPYYTAYVEFKQNGGSNSSTEN